MEYSIAGLNDSMFFVGDWNGGIATIVINRGTGKSSMNGAFERENHWFLNEGFNDF